MDIYNLNNISKIYVTENIGSMKCREIYALKNLELSIQDGESVCIMGGSGSGKTTLLKILGGMLIPSAGCIYYKGSNLYQYFGNDLEKYRRTQVGFVFQDYKLLNNLKIEDNIILPLMLDHQNIDESVLKVKKMADILKIEDKLSCYPYELSGGQQQRAAICRALINEPDVILADEPTGNLDEKSSKNVLELLLKIKNEFNKTLIIVTHNEDVAKYCDRIIRISEGKIIS